MAVLARFGVVGAQNALVRCYDATSYARLRLGDMLEVVAVLTKDGCDGDDGDMATEAAYAPPLSLLFFPNFGYILSS